MSKIKVAVIFGGVSDEHDISLISAAGVIKHIPKDKYEVMCIGITKFGRWLHYPGPVSGIESGEWYKDFDCSAAVISPDSTHSGILLNIDEGAVLHRIDVVFPVLHGKNGEDGSVQGLLQMSRIPYVGCDVLASAVCMDKCTAHCVLERSGIKMARWTQITAHDLSVLEAKCEDAAALLGFPVFVKPSKSGSSIGISKAKDMNSLITAARKAFAHDDKIIIEEFLPGRELETAVFGYSKPYASVVGEIKACNEFYDFNAKYEKASELYIPAQLDSAKSSEIRGIALKAYKAAGCKGLSRIDFIMKDSGEVYLNEINTMPGFTPISMYPQLMEQMGQTYSELIDRLLEKAIENN